MAKTVADLMIERLMDWGVDTIFGFAEALLRGERDRWDIIKTVLKDKIREVV